MHNFKELRVWLMSVELATDIYQLTNSYPNNEIYGLTSQIRRCSVSVSSNIAEGAGRSGKNEFRQYLHIAYGSSFELETQLIISRNLDYVEDEKFEYLSRKIIEIQKMLYKLIKSIE
jgi:four helix bundle protein